MATTLPLYTQPIPIRRFGSRLEWEEYAVWLRRHARVSLGLLPEPPRTPLHAHIFDHWKGDGVLCSKVYFESLPGFYVTGNLFRPTELNFPVPGILSPHGHWPQGRLQDFTPQGSAVARAYNLAKQGAVVLTYDMVGYNDSCQLPHGFPTDAPWGLSLMALQTWNSVRALDFLQSLPEVDPERLACTGESGGGTQTFALAAVDERLTVAAPIVMVSSIFHGGCQCENAPLLRVAGNNVELTRLFTPKPLFIGSCTGDWTKHTPEIEQPAIREVYQLYRAASRVGGLHVDAEHNYNQQMREAVYTFFRRHLFGVRSNKPMREEDFTRPPMRDQLVWWGRESPSPFSYQDFHRLWRRRAEETLEPLLQSPAALRATAGALLPHTVALTEESLRAYQQQKPRYIKARVRGKDLWVTPRNARLPAEAGDRDFFTYRRAPHAEAVMEILAALRNSSAGRLHGLEAAGPWCLLAAALDPEVSAVEAEVFGLDPYDDGSWETFLHIPAIRQVGGLALIFALIGPRPLILQGADEAVLELAERFARA
jgi:hypothetical protein